MIAITITGGTFAEAREAAAAIAAERVSVTFDGANIGPAVRFVKVATSGARRRFVFAIE